MPRGHATPAAAVYDTGPGDYRARKAHLLQGLHGVTLSGRRVHTALGELARLTDRTLRALWLEAGFDGRCALLAVGGYGRRELFPHSDVDVLLLLAEGSDPARDAPLRAHIECFIGRCWDVGLEIGSSVRTLGECLDLADADVTVQTALLEARHLAGSRRLFGAFQQGFGMRLDALDFFIAKRLELRQRHQKYQDTPYALEPNCKESPGGLRDLQLIIWVARAAGIGTRWQDLQEAGLITPLERHQLERNHALLARVRMRLHLVAGRREDRLVFELQNAVAESFGLRHRMASDGRVALRASELLMRRYYWAAKAVTQLSQILLQVLEERLRAARGEPAPVPQRIDTHFLDRAGFIEVADDELYQRRPQAILETFLLRARRPGSLGLSARTLRALYNARAVMDRRFRADPVNHQNFLAILHQPQGITRAFRLMNQTSVLGRYLWVFRRIVGQMQHDLFHVYTVDQHILMVLRNMRRFFIPEHAHEYPFCSQLAAGWDKPWLLYIAALFHDIAKGRGGDHSELGALEVRRFGRQHGLPPADIELTEFLVREHLAMSRVAQTQDLSDPAVIEAFARRVGTERRLTALYLLTVADVRGTSPKVWNAWKGKLLEDLYRLTARVLGGSAPDADAVVQARQRRARAALAADPALEAGRERFWATLDAGYFMRHDADEIAWHTREIAAHPASSDRALVRTRRSPAGEGLQVLVHAPDQAELFARICGWFDRSSLSILDARIHTTRTGWALDTFQVISTLLPGEEHDASAQVEAELARAIDQREPLAPPRLGRASPRVRSFPVAPHVELRPDEKGQRWLLAVSASDRPGLLYSIARVLAAHAISVELAKISTLGERVEDTFLLQGEQLQHARTQLAIEHELLQALDPGQSMGGTR
ncbi:MAG TPA: [protein-PII] uridylyltransferase [Ottowia sp.]|uniref:[protein-PII] uridylyltransferase n=1 Tax=Ottowia sp. TaxID=1898956 RepID=UPI002B70A495|nr:[protein-PII] uridylyltransferase [Ottowia sp.]HMN22784.1 [protein-PII] uridylyltransferase [Ottowia sp.]